MKVLTLLLIALILNACAAQDRREAPDWSDAELGDTQVTDPVGLPILCPVKVVTDTDGKRYGAWDEGCWVQLEAYEIIAEGNTGIAQGNASALRATESGYNSLISAGEMQQKMSEYFEDQYQDEKKGRFLDILIYRIILGIGLLGAVL